MSGVIAALDGSQPGDPQKLAERLIDVVKSEGMAASKSIPQRLAMGRDAMATIGEKCEAWLKLCNEWKNFITSMDIEGSEIDQ